MVGKFGITGAIMTNAFAIPTCHVGGHSLIQRGREWIDAAIHRMPDAPRVRILADSREFFDLLHRFPKLISLLTIGRNLQIALGGVVYEIHE